MPYLRANNPRPLHGHETQCPACATIFMNDKTCEQHKTYTANTLTCAPPTELGMYPIQRHGLTIWRHPPRPAPTI